jgi:hypothetical protein
MKEFLKSSEGMKELHRLSGLTGVKQTMAKLVAAVLHNKALAASGQPTRPLQINRLFLGNPGKTPKAPQNPRRLVVVGGPGRVG